MDSTELVRSREALEAIAELMAREIRGQRGVVSRYTRVIIDQAMFINGQKSAHAYCNSVLNKEMMVDGVYNVAFIDDLLPHNFDDISVARDLHKSQFKFNCKGIALPVGKQVRFESVPLHPEFYDEEFRQFTKAHKNTRLSRTLSVEQKIVVNSDGGIAIQSIPFFGINYGAGYQPIPVHRDIEVVCNTDDEIKKMPALIQHLSDPTPGKIIRKAKSFSDAFHELHKISGLKFGSIEDAGFPLSSLYDVVVLTGVPAHEIFGHHFEEPIRLLEYGESGTFKMGQEGLNANGVVLSDDPSKLVEGFRTRGFTYFDAYGRIRMPQIHIKDGKVAGFLGSEYADSENLGSFLRVQNSEFVGNASQHTDGQFPQPRMSCTVMDGPSTDIDLEGKLIIVPFEGHTNPTDKTYMVKAQECYVIINGVPKRIIPLQVTGGINQALTNLVLLNDSCYNTGMCGKPEPIYYPNSRGVGQVPVAQFCKTQLWRGQQVYPLPISDVHLKILTGAKEN